MSDESTNPGEKPVNDGGTTAPEPDKLATIKNSLKRRIDKLEEDLKTGNFTKEKTGT